MPSIADLYITVSSDVTGAMAGLTAVDTRLNGTSTAMSNATAAALPLAAAAGAVGAGFLGAVDVAANFEQAMSGIKAVMTPTEVQQFGGALEQLALTLGRETVFSANQAAAGIEELIRAGVSAEDVLGGAAAASVALAAATGVSIAEAAGIAAKALNIFGIEATDLNGVVDFLAGVVNATAADMSSLRLGLSDVGTVAAGLGFSLEDTATALGILADNGLTANTAGTALKTMMLGLLPTTNEQRDAFRELGFTTDETSNIFFDQEGRIKSLAEIADILNGALGDMTNQQRQATLEIMFGTQGMQAANAIAGETADSINALVGEIEQISAAEAAQTRLDNLRGSMEQMDGSFQAVQITIGNLFLPAVRSLVDFLTVLMNGFLTLPEPVQVVLVAILGISGAIAGLTAAFVLLGPVFAAMGVAFGIIVTAAAPVLVPILAIGAAVAALALAWETNFGGIHDVAAEVFAAIQPGLVNIQNALSALGEVLGTAFAGTTAALQPLMDALSILAGQYLSQLPGLVRQLGDAFNQMGEVIGAAWAVLTTGSFESLVDFFAVAGTDATGFANVLLGVRDAALNLWAVVQLLITGDFRGGIFGLQEDHPFISFLLAAREYGMALWDMLTILLGGFGALGALLSGDEATWTAWVAQLETASERVFAALGNMLGAIGDFLAGLPAFIAERGPDIWAGFVTLAWELTTRIAEALQHLLSYIGNVLGVLIPSLITLLPDPWEPFVLGAWNLGTRIAEAIGNVLVFIGQAIASIPALIEGIGDVFGPFILGAWEIGTRIAEAFGNVLVFIGQAIAGIPDLITGIGDVWGPLVTSAWEIGARIAEAFGNFMTFIGETIAGIPAMIEGLGDLFGPLVTAIWNLGGPAGDAIMNVVGFIGQAIAGIPAMLEGFGDIFGGVVAAAGELYNRIAAAIEPIRQLLANTFGAFWSWLTGAITVPTTEPAAGGGGAPGGGAMPAPTGPIVSVGTLIISSESEAQDFLNLVAEAVLASARRVSPPVSGLTALP